MSTSTRHPPRVTVLMSVFNGEPFLAPAIESILRQTFTDFEFLIIDDASTDGSLAITRSFADPRIRVIVNEANIGLTRSLNKGLAAITTELVARQDADDVSARRRLEAQVAFMDDHPNVAVVGTQARLIGANGAALGPLLPWRASSDLGLRWQMMIDSGFVHSSVMFRKAVVRDELGGYDETFRTGQDAELWTRVARRGSLANLGASLVDLRTHAGSISHGEARGSDASIRGGEVCFGRSIGDARFDHIVGESWVILYAGVYYNRPVDSAGARALVRGLADLVAAVMSSPGERAAKREFARTASAKFMLIAKYLLQQGRRLHSLSALGRAIACSATTTLSMGWRYLWRRALLSLSWRHRVPASP
ncbi:MAG TPA: glycosyltransferase family 2 protein [Gemmatimonadaceae bacterium]